MREIVDKQGKDIADDYLRLENSVTELQMLFSNMDMKLKKQSTVPSHNIRARKRSKSNKNSNLERNSSSKSQSNSRGRTLNERRSQNSFT